MTTPNMDYPMPYTVPFEAVSTASGNLTIPAKYRNESGASYHRLKEGTWRLQVSYGGTETLSWAMLSGSVTSSFGDLPTAPNGTGERVSQMRTVTVTEGQSVAIRMWMSNPTQETVTSKRAVTLFAYPVPLHNTI